MNLRDLDIVEAYRGHPERKRFVMPRLRSHLAGSAEPLHAMTRVEKLTTEVVYLAHRIACNLSAGPQPYRDGSVSIVNGRTGTLGLSYTPPPASEVRPLMAELLRELFPITAIPPHLVLFHAAQLHAMFLCIHPFRDGNGRTARLLEKWYMARHFGSWAWNIDTDTYYRQHRDAYVDNLRAIGSSWNTLQWERIVPFALMLPAAIEAHADTLEHTANTLRE